MFPNFILGINKTTKICYLGIQKYVIVKNVLGEKMEKQNRWDQYKNNRIQMKSVIFSPSSIVFYCVFLSAQILLFSLCIFNYFEQIAWFFAKRVVKQKN